MNYMTAFQRIMIEYRDFVTLTTLHRLPVIRKKVPQQLTVQPRVLWPPNNFMVDYCNVYVYVIKNLTNKLWSVGGDQSTSEAQTVLSTVSL